MVNVKNFDPYLERSHQRDFETVKFRRGKIKKKKKNFLKCLRIRRLQSEKVNKKTREKNLK